MLRKTQQRMLRTWSSRRLRYRSANRTDGAMQSSAQTHQQPRRPAPPVRSDRSRLCQSRSDCQPCIHALGLRKRPVGAADERCDHCSTGPTWRPLCCQGHHPAGCVGGAVACSTDWLTRGDDLLRCNNASSALGWPNARIETRLTRQHYIFTEIYMWLFDSQSNFTMNTMNCLQLGLWNSQSRCERVMKILTPRSTPEIQWTTEGISTGVQWGAI